jgi:hypothetical protein
MPFGSDAIRRIEAKNAFVAQERARWRDLAVSTDATSARQPWSWGAMAFLDQRLAAFANLKPSPLRHIANDRPPRRDTE